MKKTKPIFYHPDECDCLECAARSAQGGLDYDPTNDDEEFEKHEEEVFNSMATCPSAKQLKEQAAKEPKMASEIKKGSIYKSEKKCPRCGCEGEPLLALSRRDNKTNICSGCGTEESVFDFKINQSRNMIGADAFKEEIDDAVAKEKAWLKKEKQ